MYGNAYDLDVALDIVTTLKGIKSNELDKEADPDKRQRLQSDIEMMHYEREALYRGGPMQLSVMDKAFNLYAPILKVRYAT
jgi:hypothetical protein